ncbi:MAG: hypothetical protein ACKPEN_16195 [Planktothrix sp.]|uniref:hypothetical protein n=1 Tax=Planktothrix sp. TaxID=3088171 RepID=UPI0038D36979
MKYLIDLKTGQPVEAIEGSYEDFIKNEWGGFYYALITTKEGISFAGYPGMVYNTSKIWCSDLSVFQDWLDSRKKSQ